MKLTKINSKIFDKFPSQKLAKVNLRELNETDANEFFHLINNPNVAQYMGIEEIPANISEAIYEIRYWGGLFDNRKSFFWAIADKESDKLIGSCGFNFWNQQHYKAEISYELAFEYWQRGIMSEVIKYVIDFGFTKMKLQRISAITAVNNIASNNLLKKNNFVHEGVLRKYKIFDNKLMDANIYSILVEEYVNKCYIST
ncbi:MAG: GNAT family protein [Pseudomonadota bacterium]